MHARDRLEPARERLVAGTHPLERRRGRHVARAPAVELVLGAERDPFVDVEHVELGDRDLGEGVQAVRVPRRDRIEPADASRTAGRRAVLAGALAELVGLTPVQLRRERPLAHGGRVRLHDADHPRDEPRRDARADRRAARQRIRARHVRIDAPVEVAHRAELTLEEDRGVARESVLDERQRVDDPFAEGRRGAQHLVRDGLGVERLVAEALEDRVLRLELVRHARAEPPLVADLVGLDAVPRDLVRVRGAHAHAGRAELLAAALALVQAVEGDVPRHEQVRAIGDAQARRRDPCVLERRHLVRERGEVDDGARAEDAERLRIEDSRRDEVQLERAVLVHDGVAGVVPALVPDDHVRLLRQEVSDLALALVAPLGSDDGGHRHVRRC